MEKALIVGLFLDGSDKKEFNDSLEELAQLARTAGFSVPETIIQRRSKVDPAYLIGKGKAAEIQEIISTGDIGAVIFDSELKPVQQRNLEEIIKAKLIDRTRLILDIFASRARTKEGKLQVAKAQLEYCLPRLAKQGIMLDSQSGGIGTRRGPGERKLEVEQRHIREKITKIGREIELVRLRREVTRKRRSELEYPLVTIVGYTNSGKSTFLNGVSKKGGIYADNKLFATLDPTTRKVEMPGGRIVLFTDTVGFINSLPHSLVTAFRATLEETKKANCLLHILDGESAHCLEHAEVVRKVIDEIGAGEIPVINAANKSDIMDAVLKRKIKKAGMRVISARTGEGMEGLLSEIEKIVDPKTARHAITVPYEKNKFLPQIYKLSVVKGCKYSESGAAMNILCTAINWERIKYLLHKEK